MLEIKKTSFSSTSTSYSKYGTQALGRDAVSLLTDAAMEEPRAVSKQLWILLHNPHNDVFPRSSGSCGQ